MSEEVSNLKSELMKSDILLSRSQDENKSLNEALRLLQEDYEQLKNQMSKLAKQRTISSDISQNINEIAQHRMPLHRTLSDDSSPIP